MAAQAPFLVYLGQLASWTAVSVWVGMLALGTLAIWFRPRDPEVARVNWMTFAMLGLGNWGMILGWWADAGFAPVHACCLDYGVSLASITSMPWMNLGMVVLGVPPMVLGPGPSRFGLGRMALALLSATGMILGMSFGGYVAAQWLGTVVREPFLVSFVGMTVGMLAGMFLGCEFGRAIALALVSHAELRTSRL